MTDKYTALRDAVAAGPTPGPWRIGTPPPNGEQTIGTRQGLMLAVVTTGTGMEAETLANAAYIAAASPDTIAALIAERDAMREALVIAREYVTDEIAYVRNAFCGHEELGIVPEVEADFARIDAALAMGEGNG